MRLIDADLLDEVLDDKFEGCYALDVNYIQDDIIPNVPTVDAVPRELYESMESTCYKLQQALSKSWIPCGERLPDKDGDYLITYDESYANDNDYDRLVSIAPFEVASEAFGYWHQCLGTNGWLGEDWIDIPVVAWMPLPEPYTDTKGEQHD